MCVHARMCACASAGAGARSSASVVIMCVAVYIVHACVHACMWAAQQLLILGCCRLWCCPGYSPRRFSSGNSSVATLELGLGVFAAMPVDGAMDGWMQMWM